MLHSELDGAAGISLNLGSPWALDEVYPNEDTHSQYTVVQIFPFVQGLAKAAVCGGMNF